MAITPHAAVTTKRAVDRFRGSDRQALNPSPEARRRTRLYQQMQMIRLNAELKDAEAVMRRGRECAANDRENRGRAQRRKCSDCPERHVYGTARQVDRPTPMRHGAPPGRWLAPRAITAAAPGADDKIELSGGASHLKRADIIAF